MSKQKLRIIAAGLIAIAALTALLIALPFASLTLAAYLFIVADIILFLATFWQIADSGIGRYLTNAAFVLAIRPWVLVSAALSVIFPVLELASIFSMPIVWFCVIQIFVFAIAGIVMLVIGAGQEEIERQQSQKEQTTSAWKMLRCDIEAIMARTPTEFKRSVGTVRDTIRFASPVSYPALASLEHTIRGDISALGVLIDGGHDGVEALCRKICEEVKDRSNRLKTLK
jgi:hypothetical protein